MIYLSSFRLSKRKVNNPNIYPYNVFRDKYIEPFVFRPITVLYGKQSAIIFKSVDLPEPLLP